MNKHQDNRLLATLSASEYQRLSKHLEPVPITLNQILIEAKTEIESLYFPTQGVVSLVSIMQDSL